MSLTIDLPASHVFVYLDNRDEGVTIMLPCLPPMMDTQHAGFREYVDGFENVVVEEGPSDVKKLIAIVHVRHLFAEYRFSVLKPISNALLRKKRVQVIPYCADEGFLDGLMLAAELDVLKFEAVESATYEEK